MITKGLWMGAIAALVIAATSPAFACNCPKEQLIKERGTLSADLPAWPVPPAIPPQKVVPPPTAG